MKRKILKKSMSILMIIFTLIAYINPIIHAKEIGDSAKLKSIGNCHRNVEFRFDSGWSVIKCDYIGYTEGNNTYPAYCIRHRL